MRIASTEDDWETVDMADILLIAIKLFLIPILILPKKFSIFYEKTWRQQQNPGENNNKHHSLLFTIYRCKSLLVFINNKSGICPLLRSKCVNLAFFVSSNIFFNSKLPENLASNAFLRSTSKIGFNPMV